LLAFLLRTINLSTTPPGWRDDEVIETTVHAQLVLTGHYPLYFIQAEGHEPIYHYLTAGWIAVVGRSLFSVRLVSVFFGLLTVAATFRLTRQLFGTRTALLTALLLAVSFWALMYSRTKIRHVSELPFVLLGFSYLLQIVSNPKSKIQNPHVGFLRIAACVLFFTLALYTYLAATTIFIILILFASYLFITKSAAHLTAHFSGHIFLVVALVILIYLPLAAQIRANAERIAVVGGPLTALREGNLQPLVENTTRTLAMFGNTGDNEALYNLPGRPVFNLIGFFFFVGGLFSALSRWRDPRHAFLLIWLVGGLAPGFASNPPASLGHTITALPAVYILAVLPISHVQINNRVWRLVLACLLLVGTSLHDLADYFFNWPAHPAVQYLYKANLHATAAQLRGQPPATYVLSGPLSKWDRIAFALDGVAFESVPRWVNGDWAVIFPTQSAHYLFPLADWQIDSPPQQPITIQFADSLIFEGWSQQGRDLLTHWRVGPGYAAPEPDMGASVATPPSPTVIFLHLLDAQANYVGGSDRFDVDAYTLQPGDRFIQRHAVEAPAGQYQLEVGLYNPTTGERYLTTDQQDSVRLGTIDLP
jgi:4-amino-4-deoxy-L-arabinose transferase-like glycosyltransferase